MRFWKKKESVIPHTGPEYGHEQMRELTGIEKMEMEEYRLMEAAADAAIEQRRAVKFARLDEINKKIAPELAEIARLENELYPQRQWANACMQHYSNQGQGVSSGFLQGILGNTIGPFGYKP